MSPSDMCECDWEGGDTVVINENCLAPRDKILPHNENWLVHRDLGLGAAQDVVIEIVNSGSGLGVSF